MDLNVRAKIIEFLKNKGINLRDLGQAKPKILYQKHKQQKKKIDKLNFIKIKNFCVAKGTIKKTKRQLTDWEKVLAKDTSPN